MCRETRRHGAVEPGGGLSIVRVVRAGFLGGGNAPLILEGGWSERRPSEQPLWSQEPSVEAGRLRGDRRAGSPSVGSAPYPGVRAQGRGADRPLSGAGLCQGCGGCLLCLGPLASCAPRAPKPTWSQGPQGHLNLSHGPGLPKVPKAAQSSVLRFQSSTAHP